MDEPSGIDRPCERSAHGSADPLLPPPGRRAILRGSALLGAVGLAACAPRPSTSAGRRDPSDGGVPASDGGSNASAACTPLPLHPDPSAAPDDALTSLFAEYGNTSGQWSGADSTYSVALPDGRIAWLFSDTFYGPVNADGTRPADVRFLNNSVVLQAAAGSPELRTVVGTGADGAPASLVPAPDEHSWYWLGAGLPAGDASGAATGGSASASAGRVLVTALRMAKTGDGPLDFGWKDTVLAEVDLESGTTLSTAPLPSAAGIQWSAWLQEIDGVVHVYGVKDGETKTLHAARVPRASLADGSAWRFWDGAAWTPEEGRAEVVREAVANELSVTPAPEGIDGYLLLTQDTSEPYGRRITASLGCSPVGPFGEPVTLCEMTEAGPEGSYRDANVYGYNAHEHPELRTGRRITLSYNVNSLDQQQLTRDASIYRPRFVSVEL